MMRIFPVFLIFALIASLAPAQTMPSKIGQKKKPARPAAITSAPAKARTLLDESLAAAKKTPASARTTLYAGALGAAARLGPQSRQGRRLIDMALKVTAVKELRKGLEEVRGDLAFRPVEEADRPTGWPTFTTVGEVEIKRYPKYRMARAAMGNSGDMGAFFRLFNHIKKNEVAMTSPVEMNYEDGEKKAASMAFLYGDTKLGKTGKDGEVEVIDIQPVTVASLGLRGYDSRERVEKAEAALRRWLKANPRYEVAGPKRVMSWNSPMVRGQRRFFEVQIPVRSKAGRKL